MQGFLHNIGEMLYFPTIFYDRMRPPLRQMVFNLRNHLTWQFENATRHSRERLSISLGNQRMGRSVKGPSDKYSCKL